jgi:hypothetical protein
MATSSSVKKDTTRSVPPYNFGGTDSVSGAIWAMRIRNSPVAFADSSKNRRDRVFLRRSVAGMRYRQRITAK